MPFVQLDLLTQASALFRAYAPRTPGLLAPLSLALLALVERFLRSANRCLARFPFPVGFPLPRELARRASRVLALSNQAGEGWALAGEVLELAERGVVDVVCLQPFGCIANQVMAKGVERRLRQLQPALNLLFVDLDHNTSEVNLFNRLHFLLQGAATRHARAV